MNAKIRTQYLFTISHNDTRHVARISSWQTLKAKAQIIKLPSRLINGFILLQVNLIKTLSLGSMETDRVISEPCYNEVIYNRHIAK